MNERSVNRDGKLIAKNQMAAVGGNASARVEDLRGERVESIRLRKSAVRWRAPVFHLRLPLVISANRENNKDHCAEARAELASLIGLQTRLNGFDKHIRIVEACVSDTVGQTEMLSSGVFSDGYMRIARGRSSSDLTKTRAVTIDQLADQSPMRPSTPKASATFVDLDGNTIRNCPGGPLSPLVTAANYATFGFNGGIVPKATVTHTPNTCHLTITPIVNATTYTLCNNLLEQNYQILNISASSFAATTCATAPIITISDGV